MYSFYRPATGTVEAERAADVIDRGALSTGEVVKTFEDEFAAFAGTAHAVAVASGSVALELALAASDLDTGESIVVSPFNCTAVLYAVRRAGLHPLFADVDSATLNLDPRSVEAVLETHPETAGLLLTPTYGLPEPVDELIDLAAAFELTVVNDYSQAPGATVDDNLASSVGTVGICSLGATKPLTSGEGGIVTTDDPDVAAVVRRARSNSGVDVSDPPTNVRLSDVEAAIGRTQLDRYPDLIDRRRTVAATYRAALPAAVTPQAHPDGFTNVFHRFAIRAPGPDGLAAHLDASGVETSAGITKPLDTFACVETPQPGPYPETERLIEDYLMLPMHPGLDADDAHAIAEHVTDYY